MKEDDLKRLVERAFDGLAPDLGECDPSDAVQPVVDEIVAHGRCSSELRKKLRDYDPDTMKEVRGYIADIIG